MIATQDSNNQSDHEEVWLLLPWLANGHLPEAERERAERHVKDCPTCREELIFEQRLCQALVTPERVSYAPGPSFRKLLMRIDEARASGLAGAAARVSRARHRMSALWRPPGLAWAASFVLAVGLAAGIGYRSLVPQPAAYRVHTDTQQRATYAVLHIVLDRKLTIGEVEELLRSNGARVVEGPGETGIFGVAPAGSADLEVNPTRKLQALAAQLRADPRVRWVEPVGTPARDSTPEP
jgi:hypothetical protein